MQNSWPASVSTREQHTFVCRGAIAPLVALFAVLLGTAAGGTTNDMVSIELRGEIESECRLNDIGTVIELGQLEPTGSHVVTFGVHCNIPFSYSVRSAQGGLRNSIAAETPPPGFTTLVHYSVGILIPTDAGPIADLCDSSQLTQDPPACPFTTSGQGIAIAETGSLTFSWSTDNVLVAGPYTDVVTFDVRPLF
jgi:hypothetical protein